MIIVVVCQEFAWCCIWIIKKAWKAHFTCCSKGQSSGIVNLERERSILRIYLAVWDRVLVLDLDGVPGDSEGGSLYTMDRSEEEQQF
ncbi:hypothetical protein KY289_015477 [Solanum tuberosum]|nr:hypothetical protein KY289_015477 [Solanum tuberosum]